MLRIAIQAKGRLNEDTMALLADAGFTVLEPKDSHICCGSAGTYNLMQPAISAELRRVRSA